MNHISYVTQLIISAKTYAEEEISSGCVMQVACEAEGMNLDGYSIPWCILVIDQWMTSRTVSADTCLRKRQRPIGTDNIKSGTRSERGGHHATRPHRLLSPQTPLPPMKVVLSVTENKFQLIDLICQPLVKFGQTEIITNPHTNLAYLFETLSPWNDIMVF